MAKVFNKIDQKVQENSSYFTNGQLQSNKTIKHPYIVVVSAEYIFERRTFFKIKKYKDLALAIDIFAKKESPYEEFYSWYETVKAPDGFFVVVYYIDINLYKQIKTLQFKGGIILPEQSIVRKNEGLIETPLKHGSYQLDANYGAVFISNGASVLSTLFPSNNSQGDNEKFIELLLSNLKLSDIFSFWRSAHLGSRTGFKLTVGKALALMFIPLLYLLSSSAWLNFKKEQVLAKYNSNKQLVAEFKGVERTIKEKQVELEILSEPFENYVYSYPIFEIMSDMKIEYQIEMLTISSGNISIGGAADDASEIFKVFAEHPSISELKNLRPVRKSGKRDSFTIGFKLVE